MEASPRLWLSTCVLCLTCLLALASVPGALPEGLATVAERRGNADEARGHLDRAGDLFSRHGAKLYLDQVLAKKDILRA